VSLRYHLHIGDAEVDVLLQQVGGSFGRTCISEVEMNGGLLLVALGG
jgi:hypothetical protein